MKLPAFYDRVPRLRTYDPLAHALGSAQDGIIEFGYGDAVRAAGHSCPTVASAYWLTYRALNALYRDRLPERGGVRVEFRDHVRNGANGVVAFVVQVLTGAAGDTGFKGLGGRYARAGLQGYAPELPLALRYTRLDSGESVDAQADLSLLPHDPELTALLQGGAYDRRDTTALARLGELWQRRVEHLLIERADDDGVFVVRKAGPAYRRSPLMAVNC